MQICISKRNLNRGMFLVDAFLSDWNTNSDNINKKFDLMKTAKKDSKPNDVSNRVKTPSPPQVMDPSKDPSKQEKKADQKNKGKQNTLAPNEEL
jgi:hypothetical protein